MKASDRASHRWGMSSEPPNREPDFELSGWIEKGEVNWTRVTWPNGTFGELDHRKRIAALTDATWIFADNQDFVERRERPAIWVHLDNGSTATWLYSKDLVTCTDYRHALWLVRWWWRFSKWMWSLAWRALRGRG